MMTIYEIFQLVLILPVIIITGYQLLLALLALSTTLKKQETPSKHRSFLVIIPSQHNTTEAITKTLYSLSGLVYPKHLYELIVVTDNYNEDSRNVAKKLGVKVLELKEKDEKIDRAAASHLIFDQMAQLNKRFDAVIIINANSLIAGDFLEVMNNYLESGSDVIQGSNLVVLKAENWVNKLLRPLRLLSHYLNPLGRKILGYDGNLSGNGMCIRLEVLEKHPVGIRPLIDGVEYGLSLLLQGIPVDFAPEARVWSSFTLPWMESPYQYLKSEIKIYNLTQKYIKPFLNRLYKKRSLRTLDILTGLITPPLILLFGITVVFLVVDLFLWLPGYLPFSFIWMWLAIIAMEGACILMGIYACKIMYLDSDIIPRRYAAPHKRQTRKI